MRVLSSTCPLGGNRMVDPVRTSAGTVCDRVNFETWLQGCVGAPIDPVTREPLVSSAVFPDRALAEQVARENLADAGYAGGLVLAILGLCIDWHLFLFAGICLLVPGSFSFHTAPGLIDLLGSFSFHTAKGLLAIHDAGIRLASLANRNRPNDLILECLVDATGIFVAITLCICVNIWFLQPVLPLLASGLRPFATFVFDPLGCMVFAVLQLYTALVQILILLVSVLLHIPFVLIGVVTCITGRLKQPMLMNWFAVLVGAYIPVHYQFWLQYGPDTDVHNWVGMQVEAYNSVAGVINVIAPMFNVCIKIACDVVCHVAGRF